MIIVGATIENFLYDSFNKNYVSASRFVPQGKFNAINFDGCSYYSSKDVMKIQIKPVANYQLLASSLANRIYGALNIEQSFIERKDPNCLVYNRDEVDFPLTELSDTYVVYGGTRHNVPTRFASFELHFSSIYLDSISLCDILDKKLIKFHNLEKGWRKEWIGHLGRNILSKEYDFNGTKMMGFEYKTFSSGIIKNYLFDFLHAVKGAITEYNER